MTRDEATNIRSFDRNLTVASAPDSDVAELPPDHGPLSGTRETILLAGLSLFSSRGYHATSIRDIAAAAECGSASLYSHFAAKEEVLAELVQLGHAAHHRVLVTALAEADGGPPAQLRAVMAAHVRLHCEYPALAIVATYERRHLSPSAYAPTAALRAQSEQLLTDIVLRGVQQGLFVVPAVEATLVALGSMGVAVATWFASRADHLTADEIADAYAGLALRMVGWPESPLQT